MPAHCYYSNDNLHTAVKNAFTAITLELLKQMSDRTWRHIQLRFENNGEHTDIIDA